MHNHDLHCHGDGAREVHNTLHALVKVGAQDGPDTLEGWRQALCDGIAADLHSTLHSVVGEWRGPEGVLDTRCLPYAAAVLGKVWSAKLGRAPTVHLPPQCNVDTGVVHLRWSNYDGEGPFDHLTPLRQGCPFPRDSWVELVHQQVRSGLGATTLDSSSGAPGFSPSTLRQVDDATQGRHAQVVCQGVDQDLRWGLQQDTTAQLTDNNLEEWMHAYSMSHADVLLTGFAEPGDNKTQPRVWCLGTNFHTILKRDGVSGVARWGRKLDLSRLQVIFIPIHHPGHWTCVVVRVQEQRILSLDSFTSAAPTPAQHRHQPILQRVASWLRHVNVQHRQGWAEEWSFAHEWRTLQDNGWDCGVHVLVNMLRAINAAWRTADCLDMQRMRVWLFAAIMAARQVRQHTLHTVIEEAEASQLDTQLQELVIDLTAAEVSEAVIDLTEDGETIDLTASPVKSSRIVPRATTEALRPPSARSLTRLATETEEGASHQARDRGGRGTDGLHQVWTGQASSR